MATLLKLLFPRRDRLTLVSLLIRCMLLLCPRFSKLSISCYSDATLWVNLETFFFCVVNELFMLVTWSDFYIVRERTFDWSLLNH
jgi:hypothetical protein